MDELQHLIDETPFGRVTVEYHRAYGTTQVTKVRQRSQVKTPTVKHSLDVVASVLGQLCASQATGRLQIDIQLKDGMPTYTVLEPDLD